MVRKFLISKSGWGYANLVKMARSYGGPQEFLNAVHNAGQVQGIIKVLFMGAGGILGGVATWGVMQQLPWWKRKAKSEKLGRNVLTNSYVDCPDCGARFEHHSGLSLGCPNCNWGITDREFEDGEYEDDIFGEF